MWSPQCPHGSYMFSLAYMVCLVQYYLVLFCLVSQDTTWPLPVSLLVTVCLFIPTWSAWTRHGHYAIPVWSLCGPNMVSTWSWHCLYPLSVGLVPMWSFLVLQCSPYGLFGSCMPTFVVSMWSLYGFSFYLPCLYLPDLFLPYREIPCIQ